MLYISQTISSTFYLIDTASSVILKKKDRTAEETVAALGVIVKEIFS